MFVFVCVCDVLAESLRFDEDVEVGFLQLFREHVEDSGLSGEVGQLIHDQLQQQLKHQRGGKTLDSSVGESN